MAYQSISSSTRQSVSSGTRQRATIKKITGIDIDFNDIKEIGETRRFAVSGTNGAVFSLEVQNSTNTSALPTYYNFQTGLFQTAKTRLSNININRGAYTGIIKFPTTISTDTVNGAVTSGVNVIMDTAVASTMAVGDRVTGNAALDAANITVAALDVGSNIYTFALSDATAIADDITLTFAGANQYDIFLFAETIYDTVHSEYTEARFIDDSIDINSSSGSNSNLVQKVIYQTLDVDITISGLSPSSTITNIGSDSKTITTSRSKSKNKIPFSFTIGTGTSNALSIKKQPESKDIITFITATVGATPIDIPGEDIYPTARDAFTGDDINGAITSGSVVRMDAPDLSAVIAVGDRITTPVTTDGVDTDSGGDDGIVVMDSDVATIMSVGDRVTIGDGSDTALFLDANIVTVGEFVGGEDKQFKMSQPVAIIGGTELTFSSKINRSVTTVTVVETSGAATDFTMSQAILFRDNTPLTFSPRRNYRWPISSTTVDLSKIKPGMRQLKRTFFATQPIVRDYLTQTTVFEGEIGEYKIDDVRIPGLETKGIKPIETRDATTKVKTTTIGTATDPINITFSEQALLTFGGGTNASIYGYGTAEVKRLTGYDVEFSDLRVALTPITTTTTAAVNASTSVPITNRIGITDRISAVSGIGIDSSVGAPTVASGAGSVTGAGTIVLSAAQTLENGTTLTFSGTGSVASITGNVKVNIVGNEDVTLSFDVDRFLTMH